MYILHTFWAKDRILDGFSIYIYIVGTYICGGVVILNRLTYETIRARKIL